MSIHPFGLLNVDGSDARPGGHRRHLQAATTNWARKPGAATASRGWPACGPAWATPRPPSSYLDIYRKAFILRNGFHANGDQLKAGYSNFTYRPFTLEGNFLASQAVHEMLLQSWGGVIRVFPAMPARWQRGGVRRPAGRRRLPRLGPPRERRHHLAQGDGRPRRRW